MRPLGLLGGALSGAPPFAGLGAGTPSIGTYLRGDGVWAALSVAPYANQQTFTSSGTFTVPAGVTTVAVMAVGGGGGGGTAGGSRGGTGGTTTFGSYLTAPGGGGGSSWNTNGPTLIQGPADTSPASVTGTGVVGIATDVATGESTTTATVSDSYGIGRSGYIGNGNRGARAYALIPVTPGQAITVAIGAAGSGGSGGSGGVVIVRY